MYTRNTTSEFMVNFQWIKSQHINNKSVWGIAMPMKLNSLQDFHLLHKNIRATTMTMLSSSSLHTKTFRSIFIVIRKFLDHSQFTIDKICHSTKEKKWFKYILNAFNIAYPWSGNVIQYLCNLRFILFYLRISRSNDVRVVCVCLCNMCYSCAINVRNCQHIDIFP